MDQDQTEPRSRPTEQTRPDLLATPDRSMRALGLVLLVLAAAHLRTMVMNEPGLIDIVWSCNLAFGMAVFLFLWRFNGALLFTVFFWSAVGSVTWAIFLIFEPSIFRLTSLSSHVLVPLFAFVYVRRFGVPPRAWTHAAILGEISFFFLVAFHPERNYLFLFNFDAAPVHEKIVACILIQSYYAALLAAGYRMARRFFPWYGNAGTRRNEPA